jgi:hypothetical protein
MLRKKSINIIFLYVRGNDDTFGLFDKNMYETEHNSRLLILKLVKSDDVI